MCKILIFEQAVANSKNQYSNCAYQHNKTTHVGKKSLINDLTFRMSQHASSEVTVEYNTTRFQCSRERLEPNKDNCEKLIITDLSKSAAWKIYKKASKENVSRFPHFH